MLSVSSQDFTTPVNEALDGLRSVGEDVQNFRFRVESGAEESHDGYSAKEVQARCKQEFTKVRQAA